MREEKPKVKLISVKTIIVHVEALEVSPVFFAKNIDGVENLRFYSGVFS